MFIRTEYIKEALEHLKLIHPFYGMTFLVCKFEKLPVGKKIPFPINKLETVFLQKYFHPNRKSEHFYQVFKTSKKNDERWLNPDYPSSSLQTIRTRGDLAKPFLHEKDTDLWGWDVKYIETLERHLGHRAKNKIPVFYLAVWLFREVNFSTDTSPKQVISYFLNQFQITSEEKDRLLDISIPDPLELPFLQEQKASWEELKKIIGSPPDDYEPEEGGALTYLELEEIGPAQKLTIEPADRLNLITGDNGLGKSFLLDCAWWALTGQWAGAPAYPREGAQKPKITFEIAGEAKSAEKLAVSYDWEAIGPDKWVTSQKRPIVPGLSVYVRVDGSFAVFDPARRSNQPIEPRWNLAKPLLFSKEEVRDGRGTEINGLIDDWVKWQDRKDKWFETLKKVLCRLSPPNAGDLGDLEPDEHMRLTGDSRDIPTLRHRYGTVPILHTSAGVQRIITLAYLLVWVWKEHQFNSQSIRKDPERKLVILVDELESHLHPQWQRSILPALLAVSDDLSQDLSVQLIIATHSPLVVASAEPYFNSEKDKLFHIDLVQKGLFGQEAEIQEKDFIRYGRIGLWLTSEVFELKQDYGSIEAEKAVERARKLQQSENPSPQAIEAVTKELERYISHLDVFWPRWVKFAAKYGVEI